MSTLNELLGSSALFTNVQPVSSFNTAYSPLEFAHTGYFKNIIYTVQTQKEPYKQFIVAIDTDTMKVIS